MRRGSPPDTARQYDRPADERPRRTLWQMIVGATSPEHVRSTPVRSDDEPTHVDGTWSEAHAVFDVGATPSAGDIVVAYDRHDGESYEHVYHPAAPIPEHVQLCGVSLARVVIHRPRY